MLAEYVAKILASGGPADRPSDIPVQYTVGQRVKTRVHGNTFVDGGHTRLPSYARGKTGWIIQHHGAHVFPDSNAHSLGEALNRCIPLGFMHGDLWDTAENPEDEVVLDLWQSYLEPA